MTRAAFMLFVLLWAQSAGTQWGLFTKCKGGELTGELTIKKGRTPFCTMSAVHPLRNESCSDGESLVIVLSANCVALITNKPDNTFFLENGEVDQLDHSGSFSSKEEALGYLKRNPKNLSNTTASNRSDEAPHWNRSWIALLIVPIVLIVAIVLGLRRYRCRLKDPPQQNSSGGSTPKEQVSLHNMHRQGAKETESVSNGFAVPDETESA